ncbi:nucleotide-diphospho-sugar transferase-domain-containing protein [Endogone sp. FLAS-F59071]|nr:nucleotide-diphospho-sugar transferase-domain-containing protein [Endogone sp. FLAS-F59071]|eukprot:RUS15905.1 nucleotide-diphospho-sugar transferase-domain-containing protein [Endogone sp. FLAS-F59071]
MRYGRIYMLAALLVVGFISLSLRVIQDSPPIYDGLWGPQDAASLLEITKCAYADNDPIDLADYAEVDLHTLPTFPEPPPFVQEALDRNLVAGRYLITTVVNSGMLEYTLNWAESLRLTGYKRFLIFCIDESLFDTLSERGLGDRAVRIPQEWFHVNVSAGFESYRQPEYKAITHAKSLVVERLLHTNITVLFSDVDIVILKPRMLDYFRARLHSRPGTDMLFSVEIERSNTNVINSGFYLMRPTNTSRWVIKETVAIQDHSPTITQQKAMNAAIRKVTPVGSVATSRHVALLDVFLFPNGYVYFYEQHQSLKALGVDPFIVHANFVIGDGKKEVLKQAGLWYLKEEEEKKEEEKKEEEKES